MTRKESAMVYLIDFRMPFQRCRSKDDKAVGKSRSKNCRRHVRAGSYSEDAKPKVGLAEPITD